MLDPSLQTPLDEKFLAMFSMAKLRSTEVALVLSLDRVTVSNYKSYGTGVCKELTRRKIEALSDIVGNAVLAKDLPFEDRDITGKINRLAALKLVLRKHKKK